MAPSGAATHQHILSFWDGCWRRVSRVWLGAGGIRTEAGLRGSWASSPALTAPKSPLDVTAVLCKATGNPRPPLSPRRLSGSLRAAVRPPACSPAASWGARSPFPTNTTPAQWVTAGNRGSPACQHRLAWLLGPSTAPHVQSSDLGVGRRRWAALPAAPRPPLWSHRSDSCTSRAFLGGLASKLMSQPGVPQGSIIPGPGRSGAGGKQAAVTTAVLGCSSGSGGVGGHWRRDRHRAFPQALLRCQGMSRRWLPAALPGMGTGGTQDRCVRIACGQQGLLARCPE